MNHHPKRSTHVEESMCVCVLSPLCTLKANIHYNEVIVSTMASQITRVSIVYLTVCSGPDQRKHQSSVSLTFVRGIHWWPVNLPTQMPVMWKVFPFDDVILLSGGGTSADTARTKFWLYLHTHPALVRLTHWSLRDLIVVYLVKLPSSDCH